jgi:hypothetical protein
MDVKLNGWSYKNIRGGLAGVDIKLGNPPSRWTLIQMPNGMGKTTTMHLLRAAFSGGDQDPEIVRGFRPSDDVNAGEFELVISVSGQTFRITVSLNYEAGTINYHTARAGTQSGGKEAGHVLPDELKTLLTPEFTKLFIFDGELARQIREVKREKASEAIRALSRLDKLAEIRKRIEDLITQEQQRSSVTTKTQTSQGLKALRTRYETAKGKLAELTRLQQRLRSLVDTGESRTAELEKSIREHMQQGADFRSRVLDLEAKKRNIDLELVEITKGTLAELRNPAAMHPRIIEELGDLGHKMQRLKLPKTMSIEFFHELAMQPTCVCGRVIGAGEKAAILARANDYLSEDQIGVVNAIKSAVRQYEVANATFDDRAGQLRLRIEQRQRLSGDWARLEAERIAAGDVELDQLKSELEQHKEEVEENDQKIIALTCTELAQQRGYGVDEKTNIPLCKKEVRDRERALAEATGTVSFLKKALATKDIIEQIENRALDLIKERLRKATNDKLRTFIPGEGIRVARIGGALELESDQLGSKQHVSEGQSLAIAYAFLTSLFEQASYRFPFIVDSPAGSLDLEVRREVAELIPTFFDQMIMFVISSEREGFAEPFYEKEGVRFCTIWRDGSNKTQVSNELRFFKQFHSDER